MLTTRAVWPFVNGRSGGYNKTGIALALLAILEFAYRPAIAAAPATPKSYPVQATRTSSRWLSTSIALGGLLFSLHSLVSDPSTLIAWSWTGYPIKGPVPNQHGSLTHVAQAVGLALAILFARYPMFADALAQPLFAFGAASAYVLYMYKDWTGYAGGLGVSMFLMAAVPVVWARAKEATQVGGVAKVTTVAWLVVCVFDVLSTFTVAYAFVPGGVYLRERTDL